MGFQAHEMFDDQLAHDGFLLPGTRLGKYEIVRGLAVGGMAELYLARTTGMQEFRRVVALKRIHPKYTASPEFTSMFVDEARLVARLEHPNVAQVFDIGRDEAGLFFTMEYVHGPDVRRILQTAQLRDKQVPIEHGIAIVVAAARALDAAHNKRARDGTPLGIVHRDVSPSNVLVSFDGVVKVIDFGVAKAKQRKTKTRDGTIKGKVSYMSPEQGRGDVLDCRSDIFSLGILLWELTTTRKLYFGNSDFAILRQIVHRDAPRPSALVPKYPPALEAIVMRALSRNIGKRYQSAREFADALDELREDKGNTGALADLGLYVRHTFPDALEAGQKLTEWCERVPSGALLTSLDDEAGEGKRERDGESADDRALRAQLMALVQAGGTRFTEQLALESGDEGGEESGPDEQASGAPRDPGEEPGSRPGAMSAGEKSGVGVAEQPSVAARWRLSTTVHRVTRSAAVVLLVGLLGIAAGIVAIGHGSPEEAAGNASAAVSSSTAAGLHRVSPGADESAAAAVTPEPAPAANADGAPDSRIEARSPADAGGGAAPSAAPSSDSSAVNPTLAREPDAAGSPTPSPWREPAGSDGADVVRTAVAGAERATTARAKKRARKERRKRRARRGSRNRDKVTSSRPRRRAWDPDSALPPPPDDE